MRILFLQKRLLFPADTGGKIRTLNVLRHLARWHEITYLCNVQSGDEPFLDPMRQLGVRLETVPWRESQCGSPRFALDLALNLASAYPFNVQKDYDPRLRARAGELLARERYDLLICDFVQMARNAIRLPVAASLLFQHNVEAEVFERHTRSVGSLARRAYMAIQSRKMRRFEGRAGRAFDAVIAVSKRDRREFESRYGWPHVEVIDTAVDTEYHQPDGGSGQPDRIVFVGSLDWLPNQDGVEHFVREIWPQVRAVRPKAVFQVVGRNPPRALTRLQREPGVEVIGSVPDVRPCLRAAAVVVVPLRAGGGTRLKIFEALAMQKAVVSTSLGAEGLSVKHGQHLLIADTPNEFAAAVTQLLESPEERARLGGLGRRLVCENFSAETIARQFEAICLRIVRDCPPIMSPAMPLAAHS